MFSFLLFIIGLVSGLLSRVFGTSYIFFSIPLLYYLISIFYNFIDFNMQISILLNCIIQFILFSSFFIKKL